MRRIDMNYFYMCINVNQMKCYMFLFIENTDEWEGWTSIRYFPIDSSKSFTLLLFNFLQIHDTNNLSNKLWHIFSYLMHIILEILELFHVDSISILRKNLLLLTQYICRKIVIRHFVFFLSILKDISKKGVLGVLQPLYKSSNSWAKTCSTTKILLQSKLSIILSYTTILLQFSSPPSRAEHLPKKQNNYRNSYLPVSNKIIC